MIKCYMTGVPLKLKDAYLLDKPAVLKTICKLNNDIRQLEYLLDHLGKVDKVPGSRKNDVLHRMVSKPAVEGLTTEFPDNRLFISWESFKINKLVNLIKILRRESIYAKSIQQLSNNQILASAKIGRTVFLHFDKHVRFPISVRHAVLAGLCTITPHWSAGEIIALVNGLRFKRHNPLPLLPESAKLAVDVINKAVAKCTI